MSFGGPLPTLTSPVKEDHVFLLCFCLNSQNWTLESFGKSYFQPLNHCFYLLFHFVPQAIWCVQVRCLLSFLPLPPPSPTSLLLHSLLLLILSLLLFLLSVTCIPPSSYFTSLSPPPHFLLSSFSSLPSLPPFLSSFPLTPQSLPPFPLQTDEVKNV